MKISKAILGAGCFWGVEEKYRTIKGITDTKVGYAGGNLENPTYEDVCSGTTGHAEVVKLEFDDAFLSFEKILDHFWLIHDPTQLNRQGYDIGHQYRSVIFFQNEKQKQIAENSTLNIQKKFNSKIETEVVKFESFFLAEEYHQKYILKKTKTDSFSIKKNVL